MKVVIKLLILIVLLFSLNGCVMIQEPEDIVVAKTIYRTGYDNSLWPGENKANMLFVDNKASAVRDIVTVLIEEESLAEKEASTETSKDSGLSLGISSLFGLQLNNPTTLAKGALTTSNTNDFTGEGKTKRSGKFKAIIAAKIVEILENGNLFIKGKRNVRVNHENQVMSISGIVRPTDISYDNTVLSRYIADAKIVYSGNGVINDKQKPGWAIRLFDLIWPF